MIVKGRAALLAPAAFALGWAGYAALSWSTYGRPHRTDDPLLDRFMPDYEVSVQHDLRADVPVEFAFAAACNLDIGRSWLVRALFRARELLLRAPHDASPLPSSFLAQAPALGWQILGERDGREVALGTVTRPWEKSVAFHAVDPRRFAAFDAPGYVQIAFSIGAEPLGADAALLRTTTRVRTTDPRTRATFRLYWAAFSPGIALIRQALLRVARDEAEKAFRRDPSLDR